MAARCRVSLRAPDWEKSTVSPRALNDVVVISNGTVLTDVEWERVLPLLPPQRPRIGRPRHNHRVILSGILSVVRTGASWREMPEEFGKWETAYKRYQLWRENGLWQRIARFCCRRVGT